ncbi:MAG TPA: LPS export ABC transporter permease LptF [Deltaproteobacteria bacterium]|nr:LPS export ABC transporter permease LptF [Deltaproteobacteria bacterium]
MHKIIFRYIFKEIAVIFLLTLFVLTFVLFMGKILQIMDLIVNKGVSLFDIVKLIIFLLPSFMTLTVPVALLIAILITIGKLSADNEITALKSSGVSLKQIFYPVGFASSSALILTLFISLFLIPKSNLATKNLLFDMTFQHAKISFQEKEFNDGLSILLLYADKVSSDGHFMQGVLIHDRRIKDEPNTILAKNSFLASDPDLMLIKIILIKGAIHTVSKDFKNYRRIDFDRYDINIDLSRTIKLLGVKDKDSKELSLVELVQKIKSPDTNKNMRHEVTMELHKRFSIPLSCIVFGLLALPLGIRSHRAVKSRGFALGIILATLYYVLIIAGEALVETGYLLPEIGAWLPNMIFAGLGICLFVIAHKEIPVFQIVKNRLRHKTNPY